MCHFGGNHIKYQLPNQEFYDGAPCLYIHISCKLWIFCFDVVKSNLDFQMSYEFATIGKGFFGFDS